MMMANDTSGSNRKNYNSLKKTFPSLELGYFRNFIFVNILLERNPLSERSKQILSEINGCEGVFFCWSE